MPVMQNFEPWFVPDFFGGNEFLFKRREEGVAVRNLTLDQRQIKVGAARQGLLVNLCAAADEDIVRKLLRIQPVQRIKNQNLRPLVLLQFAEVELVGPFEIA